MAQQRTKEIFSTTKRRNRFDQACGLVGEVHGADLWHGREAGGYVESVELGEAVECAQDDPGRVGVAALSARPEREQDRLKPSRVHRPQLVNRLGLAPVEVALHGVPSAGLVGVPELHGDLRVGVPGPHWAPTP